MAYQVKTTGVKSSSAQQTALKFVITGWSVRETGGSSTVTLKLYQGTDNTGALIANVTCAAGGSVGEDYANPVVLTTQGSFYLEKSGSGTLEAVVRGR